MFTSLRPFSLFTIVYQKGHMGFPFISIVMTCVGFLSRLFEGLTSYSVARPLED